VIGHQGTNVGVSPNTMRAFKRAARCADVIETDVQFTRDGVMVVFHDKTLDSSTTGAGPVADKTYRQLRRCRMSDGLRIPSFVQLLSWIKTTRLTLVAEMKLDGWTAEQARAYARLVRRSGMINRVVASSFDPTNIVHLHAADPEIATALVFSREVPSLELMVDSGAISMPWFRSATVAQVDDQHAAGLQVWCWTARSVDQYRRALELGADGIVADDPESLRRWLDSPTGAGILQG
jgi:glycerophosphoryl diester phosphodiesterase